MAERRSTARTRTLRTGKILLNRRASVIDCTVRNLSPGGACLEVQSPVGIPQTFELSLDGERGTHRCVRAWQTGNRLGVSFQDATGSPSSAKAEERGTRSPTQPEPTVGPPRGATDVVRSELFRLRASLDEVPFGIVLLDAELRAQFVNRAYRKIWRLPDATADSKPAFIALMQHARDTRAHAIPPDQIDAYVAKRVALVRAGDPTPIDLRLTDGEVLRFQCSVLPDGGRMLSYTYVTDIVKHSDELEVLHAALDNVRMGVILLDPNLKVRFMNAAVRQIWKISADDLKRQPALS